MQWCSALPVTTAFLLATTFTTSSVGSAVAAAWNGVRKMRWKVNPRWKRSLRLQRQKTISSCDHIGVDLWHVICTFNQNVHTPLSKVKSWGFKLNHWCSLCGVLPAVSYRLSLISFRPIVMVVTYFSNTDGAYFCFWHTKEKCQFYDINCCTFPYKFILLFLIEGYLSVQTSDYIQWHNWTI